MLPRPDRCKKDIPDDSVLVEILRCAQDDVKSGFANWIHSTELTKFSQAYSSRTTPATICH
jgi:hypothetical protein